MLIDFVSNLQVMLSTHFSSLNLCFLTGKGDMWDYRWPWMSFAACSKLICVCAHCPVFCCSEVRIIPTADSGTSVLPVWVSGFGTYILHTDWSFSWATDFQLRTLLKCLGEGSCTWLVRFSLTPEVQMRTGQQRSLSFFLRFTLIQKKVSQDTFIAASVFGHFSRMLPVFF